MQIDIQTRGFSLTHSIRNYTKQLVSCSFANAEDHIKRVIVRLSDINGPRGGVDKRCHVQVSVAGIHDVVVEDTEIDLYAAIDRAIDRTKRTLQRKIGRYLTLSKQMRPLKLDLKQALLRHDIDKLNEA